MNEYLFLNYFNYQYFGTIFETILCRFLLIKLSRNIKKLVQILFILKICSRKNSKSFNFLSNDLVLALFSKTIPKISLNILSSYLDAHKQILAKEKPHMNCMNELKCSKICICLSLTFLGQRQMANISLLDSLPSMGFTWYLLTLYVPRIFFRVDDCCFSLEKNMTTVIFSFSAKDMNTCSEIKLDFFFQLYLFFFK